MLPRLAELLAIVQSSPPLHSRELAARYGCSVGYTVERLRELRDLGHVGSTDQGRHTRWCTPDKLSAARAEIVEALRVRNNAIRAAKWRAQIEREEAELEAWEPMRRIVPAHQCLPIGRVGPISVFNLAQA